MTVNTITIVLNAIKSSVHRLVTAMYVNYAINAPEDVFYFSFHITRVRASMFA